MSQNYGLRGPICGETNRPTRNTPGPWGTNDAGDPCNPTVLEMLSGPVGVGRFVSAASSIVSQVGPGGPIVELAVRHLLHSVDQRDLDAVKRIIDHIKNNPEASLKNLKALTGAALRTAQEDVRDGALQKLSMQFGTPIYLIPVAVGCVVGALQALWETLESLYGMVVHTDEFVDDIIQLLEILLSPGGEDACREMGRQSGAQIAADVNRIANAHSIVAAYEIGKIIGPTVVGVIIAVLTAGGGAAAVASGRMAQIIAKIRRIPGGSRIMDRISRRRHRGPLDGVTDAEIDGALEAITSPPVTGGRRPRIGDRRVPTSRPTRLEADNIPRRSGETLRAAIQRIQTVIGHRIDGNSAVNNAWNRARQRVLLDNSLTSANARELYDTAREQFWREVRDDSAAKKYFEDAGFDFPAARERPPMLRNAPSTIPESEIRISLDHVKEIAQGQNWQRALDADNLRFEFQMPNTFREIIQSRHPDLRQ